MLTAAGFVFVLTVAAALYSTPMAALCSWGGESGSWFDADNWGGSGCTGVPTEAERARISRSRAHIVIAAQVAETSSLSLQRGHLTATHSFQGGDDFTVFGAPISDALHVQVGIDVNVTRDVTLRVSHKSWGGSEATTQAALGVRF